MGFEPSKKKKWHVLFLSVHEKAFLFGKKTEGSLCALCLETLEMYKSKTNRVSVYGYNTNIRINMNKQHLIFELEL